MMYKPTNRGFSLFELVVVLCLIAILFALGAHRYLAYIEASQRATVNYQAAAFLRSVENIHALAALGNKGKVTVNGKLNFYINSYGWPVSSSMLSASPRRKVSEQACKSLWLGLFTTLEQAQQGFAIENFVASALKPRVCRYSLSRKQEGHFYFDYDVKSGRVNVTQSP